MITPCVADISQHRCDFFVAQYVGEWRHAVGTRVAAGSRRIASVHHHADRVHRREQGERVITDERLLCGRFASTRFSVALNAVFFIQLGSPFHHLIHLYFG